MRAGNPWEGETSVPHPQKPSKRWRHKDKVLGEQGFQGLVGFRGRRNIKLFRLLISHRSSLRGGQAPLFLGTTLPDLHEPGRKEEGGHLEINNKQDR